MGGSGEKKKKEEENGSGDVGVWTSRTGKIGAGALAMSASRLVVVNNQVSHLLSEWLGFDSVSLLSYGVGNEGKFPVVRSVGGGYAGVF